MADLINERDSLNQGRLKLNEGINQAESAKIDAMSAVLTATDAKETADRTKHEVREIVREQTSGGDVIPEVVQARGEHATVSERLESVDLSIEWTRGGLEEVKEQVPEEFGFLLLEPHPISYDPVLTKDDITDIPAKFVADPFVVKESNQYHMFLEVADLQGKGHIGHATSLDGYRWNYDKLILSDNRHFAYPYVFKWAGEWYMLPDRGSQVPGLTLYKAFDFPYDWRPVKQMFSSGSFVDSTLIYWKGTWYLFYYDTGLQQTLIKYSDSFLDGPWVDHASNPFTRGLHLRPGGRPVVSKDKIDIFMQDGTSGVYGERLWQYRITSLSKGSISFDKVDTPVIEAQKNNSWNSQSMHHLDMIFTNRNSLPIAIVDGTDESGVYSIGIFTTGTRRKKPYLRAVRNSPQSIPTGAWTKIEFDRVVNDSSLGYDSPGQKYVVQETGHYIMSASIACNFTNTPNPHFIINMRLLQNGLEARTSPKYGESSSFNIPRTYVMNDVVLLKKGDEITLEFFHAAGAAQNVINQGWATWLTLTKVD